MSPRRAVGFVWPLAAIVGGVAALDEWLYRTGRPMVTTRVKIIRRNVWGKPLVWGFCAGLAAHLLTDD